jgi:hypothetical protein
MRNMNTSEEGKGGNGKYKTEGENSSENQF